MKDMQVPNEKLDSIWPTFGDLFIFIDVIQIRILKKYANIFKNLQNKKRKCTEIY